MVKFCQVSNIALKSSYRKCSIKKAVLKHLAILIGKHLCWSLFLINLQAYKPTTFLQRDSNTAVFKIFKNTCFKKTPVNDCFWTLLIQSGRYSRAVFRDFFGTPFFEMVIFPYRHHGCLWVQKLRVFKTSDLLKGFSGGVKYVTLVPYNTE